MNYENHPYADLFPMMPEKKFRALVSDIAIDGLQNPITLFQGKILDGRSRYLACHKAKVKPDFVEVEDVDFIAFVKKGLAEHPYYKAGQRAVVGAKMLPFINDPKYKGEYLGLADVGAIVGVNKTVVAFARTVLDHGSDLEKRDAIDGIKGPSGIAKAVKKRGGIVISPGGYAKGQRKTAAQEIAVQRFQMAAGAWAGLRGAIQALGSMPLPADTLRMTTRVRANVTTPILERVPEIIEWLIEFNGEIEKSKTVKKDEKTNDNPQRSATTGNDHDDAGNGDEAAGPQRSKPPAE